MKRIATLALCVLLFLFALAGCQPSRETLLADGIVAEEYDRAFLLEKVESAVLNGQTQIDINFLGRKKSVQWSVEAGMGAIRGGLSYTASRFISSYKVECSQEKGYVPTQITLLLRDEYLFADMPRDNKDCPLVEGYAADNLEALLMHMMETKQTRALRLYAADDLDVLNAAMKQDLDNIMRSNYAYSYLVSSAQWALSEYALSGAANSVELDITLNYLHGTIPLAEIPVVGSDMEMIESLVAGWAAGQDKVTLILEDLTPDEESLFNWINIAEVNSATLACEGDSIWYEILENPSERQIGRFWLEFDARPADIAAAQAELHSAIDSEAQAIRENLTDPSDERAAYRAIYDHVMKITKYDDDIRKATEQKTLTEEMQILRSAYGSLVAGKTVCTGYARAFKALCDALDIPCWTVNGYMDGEGHAWNVVLLNGETFYVDCTFGDTGGRPNRYFLFTEEDMQKWKYVPDEGFIIPW